ncbi:MAG: hypothetical protein M3Z26_07340 [Bacteroidota bacterium]|nr:hypothetical protein [Bacteroidota bacterium]
MQDLITSFLIQGRECSLPEIGKFRINTKSSEPDIANHLIYPPTDEIIFSDKPEKISENLVKYISDKKNINQAEALEKIKHWCSDAKERLNEGEKIIFTSIGHLEKNASGIMFIETKKQLIFFEPVTAEIVIHKNATHAMLVGDKETTSVAMNQFFQEEDAMRKSPWKIAAIILFLIAIVILFIHFYSHPFSLSSTGNQTQHSPETPIDTYSSQ